MNHLSKHKSFTIIEGNIGVMVSAPHSTQHSRNGKTLPADKLTGEIAIYLHKKTGCHVIYSNEQLDNDPNYDESNNFYQKALREYIDKNNVKLLVDLHGAAKEHDFAIDVGTVDDKDTSLNGYDFIYDLIKQTFNKSLSSNNHKENVVKNNTFSGGNQNTVTKFISSKTSIPCIQLEINKEYRTKVNPDKLKQLLHFLIDLIKKLNVVINNKNEGIFSKYVNLPII